MENKDNRNLSPAELAILRERAVRAVLRGEPQNRVAEMIGVSKQTVCGWVKEYCERGEASLEYQRRGRKTGGGVLNEERGAAIVELITTKLPDQLGLSFFLWTRAAVVELIAQRYGVRVSEQCAGEYLRKWEMTPQKPARRAWQQDSAAVQE